MKSSSSATNRRRRSTVQVKARAAGYLKVFKRRARSVRPQSEDRFTDIVMRVIKARFPQAPFTRDDVLSVISQMRFGASVDAYGINDVATCTRYRKVCDAVQRLVASGSLSSLDGRRLCVPEAEQQISRELPPQVAYLPTIRRLIEQNFRVSQTIDVMSVVDFWHSDQHLPQNIKRMTVRSVFPLLLRDRVLRRGTDNEFIVEGVDFQMSS